MGKDLATAEVHNVDISRNWTLGVDRIFSQNIYEPSDSWFLTLWGKYKPIWAFYG